MLFDLEKEALAALGSTRRCQIAECSIQIQYFHPLFMKEIREADDLITWSRLQFQWL